MTILRSDKDFAPGQTIKIFNSKIIKKYNCTSIDIKKLEEWEVFVFGSNKNGDHAGGAAKLALDKFGAKTGVAEGLFGNSYAFPTLNDKMEKVSESEINESINKLIKSATENTTKIFLVTKVGCGIAGFKEEEMMKIFKLYNFPANIVLPENWRI